ILRVTCTSQQLRLTSLVLLSYASAVYRHQHSFPTRRSSDLLVNSYKRLVPGYEAPVYIAWSAKNRSPLIRVPAARGAGTRVELRSEEHTSELQSRFDLVCRLLLEIKNDREHGDEIVRRVLFA